MLGYPEMFGSQASASLEVLKPDCEGLGARDLGGGTVL